MSGRVWFVSGFAAAWLAVVVGFGRREPVEPGVLRVRGLQVVDERGVTRVSLAVVGEATTVTVTDAQARSAVTVRASADGHASLLVSAPAGFVRAAEDGVVVSGAGAGADP